MTTNLGYETVTITKTRDTGWGYRATFASGAAETGGVFCEASCTPDEAVDAWLSEHVGYSGKTPRRVERTPKGGRTLRW